MSMVFDFVQPHSKLFVLLWQLLNSGVVMRATNTEGHETNYYGIINKILEFSFIGNKEPIVVFFDCD
jgi:hypothetical protein